MCVCVRVHALRAPDADALDSRDGWTFAWRAAMTTKQLGMSTLRLPRGAPMGAKQSGAALACE